jgi:hypothetical protein
VRLTTTGLVPSMPAMVSDVARFSWRSMCINTWSMRDSRVSFLIDDPFQARTKDPPSIARKI